jgi:hypothetical protein
MIRALESQGIPLVSSQHSSLWSARTAIMMSLVTLEELNPRHLRGYGEMQPEDAQAVTAIYDSLRAGLQRIEASLSQCVSTPGKDAWPILPPLVDRGQIADQPARFPSPSHAS